MWPIVSLRFYKVQHVIFSKMFCSLKTNFCCCCFFVCHEHRSLCLRFVRNLKTFCRIHCQVVPKINMDRTREQWPNLEVPHTKTHFLGPKGTRVSSTKVLNICENREFSPTICPIRSIFGHSFFCFVFFFCDRPPSVPSKSEIDVHCLGWLKYNRFLVVYL